MTANVRKDPEVKELSISAQLKEVRTYLNIKIGQGHFFLRIHVQEKLSMVGVFYCRSG